MKRQYPSRQICRRLAATLLAFAAVLLPLAARAEKANVFFIHGANVSEQDARAWAAEMFKRLWQAGANMEFHPVAWESDIGPSYNYQVNVSNAFVTASRLAPYVNSIPGRRVVIAHSLGTMVAAAAIQDYGMQVEKLIMLNSAIPSEAFDPSLFNPDPQNHLVHDDWMDYTNVCWTARWNELFAANDSRGQLTWRGRFANVASVAVNFYSSGDEVLEIYTTSHNPSVAAGVNPSGHWGDRYSWHKQELYKGRRWLLAFMGTTHWSGWGFRMHESGYRMWYPQQANAVQDVSVFSTNMVFNPYPSSIMNPSQSRLEIDSHLAQGIPALSPPTGRTRFRDDLIQSIDMNTLAFKPNGWPRPPAAVGSDDLGDNWLHSDIKDVAYYYTHKVFQKIVEVGGLR